MSKGLTGPKSGFDMPIMHDLNTGRHEICFVEGQDMMVRHDLVCGRKAKRA